MPTRRQLLIGATGAVLAGALAPTAVRGAPPPTVCGGLAFGTYWRATLPAGADGGAVERAITAIVSSIDLSMSPFRPDSEITRFNLTDAGGPLPASSDFVAVTAEALRVAALTEGAFEPTVGPLVGRFGFGPIQRGGEGRFTEISVATGSVSKTRAVLTLDLCGVAKGYALDLMVAALDGLGIERFLIELGGEVAGRGGGWRIGIENPLPGPESIRRVVGLDGLALATSGDRYNGLDLAGVHFSHIIDPISQRPVDNGIASVSVLAPSAARADALATGLMAMGLDRGAALAEREGVPALFLVRQGADLGEHRIAGFDAHILV